MSFDQPFIRFLTFNKKIFLLEHVQPKQDILYLIFKELQYDKETLYSCLSVSKIWSEIIISILWKNPWNVKNRQLLSVIMSHLSEKSKNNLLKEQGIQFLISSYQRPLFNYISFCRHLNLYEIIDDIYSSNENSAIKNEIFNLFINEGTKFTHLYVPSNWDYQINHTLGNNHCFSELEYLYCNTGIKENILVLLKEICESIKELELSIQNFNNNYGIARLIETPKKLLNIRFQGVFYYTDRSFCKILENSLVKHANTIQYFKLNGEPAKKTVSS